jgi:hypothetical protein
MKKLKSIGLAVALIVTISLVGNITMLNPTEVSQVEQLAKDPIWPPV